MNTVPVVRDFRGEMCENVHFASTVVCSKTGNVRQMFPNSSHDRVFLRSAAKPFQAYPLYQNPASHDIPLEEWAIICASHAANDRQLALVERVLQRANAKPSDLQCGPHPPIDEAMAKTLICANQWPEPIHNNCSGKHAGMLLACHLYGWPKETYLDPNHPLQQAIWDVLAAYSGTPHIAVAVDGCGAPVFCMPMEHLARLYANLATQPEFARIREAMTTYPELIGDAQRIDTRLMQITQGNVIAKVGAEGFIGICNQETGEGLALKVTDGNNSIRDRLVIAVLTDLGWLSAEQAQTLWDQPQFAKARFNTQGKPIGEFQFSLPWVIP